MCERGVACAGTMAAPLLLLQLQLLLLLLALAEAARSAAYPFDAYDTFERLGGKRYGRVAAPALPWAAPPPAYAYGPPAPAPAPAPAPYYGAEPVMSYAYPRDYSDSADYYYAEPSYVSYPYYYPSGKFAPAYHRSFVPYYYSTARPQPQPLYGYYDDAGAAGDGLDEIVDEIVDEGADDGAMDVDQDLFAAQPDAADVSDVTAVFLKNLVLSQLYGDAGRTHAGYRAPEPRYAYAYALQEEDPSAHEDWVYGDVRAHAGPDDADDDVRALKSLVKKDEARARMLFDMLPPQPPAADDDDARGRRISDRKDGGFRRSGRAPAPAGPERQTRPGAPAPAPTPAPTAHAPAHEQPKQHSVYETIRKLIHMQETLGEPDDAAAAAARPAQHPQPPQHPQPAQPQPAARRFQRAAGAKALNAAASLAPRQPLGAGRTAPLFVTNEEALVQQLNGLKKSA